MDILKRFNHIGKNINSIIGIGLGESKNINKNVREALIQFLNSNSNGLSLYGSQKTITDFSTERHILPYKSKITYKQSNNPELEIITDLKSKKINAAIRGTLKSNTFIKYIKEQFKIQETNRLALLESVRKEQFFFGPVGIDECNNSNAKIKFIESTLTYFDVLNIIPRISILSGGRLSDIGRDRLVDISIEEANKVIDYFKKAHPNLNIKHDEILIENAVSSNSNLIIAPNGISGNLIYRTLVHIGGGKAYGAIYLDLNKVIIDTSRVGDASEYLGALIMAKSLTKSG
ncbi:MAG: methanogenesis marker protein Mmp4/MtxX [Candidatus Hermodarchaeota archaeon]